MGEPAPFDPEWLAAEQMMGGRNTMKPAPALACRAEFDSIFANIRPMLPPPTPAVKTEDITYGPNNLTLRLYIPTNTNAPSPLPIGLYIHSGGWFAGSFSHEDFLCRNISSNSSIILASPNYRLAPENPYPAGLDDCAAAYEWLHSHAADHNGDPTRTFIMGGSAGGNLAAAVALKYATHATLRPAGLITACLQSCDVRVFPEKYAKRYTPELYADSPVIGRDLMLLAAEWYACPDPKEGLYSVLLHEDLGSLPPTVVVATEKDPTYQ
jgi:acetyl esterase/lipase